MSQSESASWEMKGIRAVTPAGNPKKYTSQHISPLFWESTFPSPSQHRDIQIVSEEQFWNESDRHGLRIVSLDKFRISDWFPRTPGVYWSKPAREVRRQVFGNRTLWDSELGEYVTPKSKMGLIEEGGIGTFRLRPRKIDNVDCWLGTVLVGTACCTGIPVVIPDSLLFDAGVNWGDYVKLRGRVRYLQDAGLDDVGHYVHHARPLIVFVEEIEGLAVNWQPDPIVITPVGLFQSIWENSPEHRTFQYSFVHCNAGPDAEIDRAAEWIDKYAKKHSGDVITNFDEQRPTLADAPLSYQRLVAKTHSRQVVYQLAGPVMIDRLDQLVHETVNTKYIGGTHVGHNISVGGSAIINIDSVLTNVTQAISAAPGLDSVQRSELESLVGSMKRELDTIKADHADEVEAIASALEKAVANAAKPPQERKKNFLQLSAKGLKDAAELVKDIAPTVLATADQIAKFIVGL